MQVGRRLPAAYGDYLLQQDGGRLDNNDGAVNTVFGLGQVPGLGKILLFVPLLLVGRHIEKRLDDVQAGQAQIEQRQEIAAASIATLAEEVSQAQAQLRRTREEMTEAVVSRLAATRERSTDVRRR